MMPEMDGVECLRLLRAEQATPVILLTARVEIHGVVLVLVYVIRNEDTVRPISLRRASRAERTLYANSIQFNKS